MFGIKGCEGELEINAFILGFQSEFWNDVAMKWNCHFLVTQKRENDFQVGSAALSYCGIVWYWYCVILILCDIDIVWYCAAIWYCVPFVQLSNFVFPWLFRDPIQSQFDFIWVTHSLIFSFPYSNQTHKHCQNSGETHTYSLSSWFWVGPNSSKLERSCLSFTTISSSKSKLLELKTSELSLTLLLSMFLDNWLFISRIWPRMLLL